MLRDLNVLCYGGGINSVALLFEATKRGIIFDAIMFANPGSEKKKTYHHIDLCNEWCKEHGQPGITTVRTVNMDAEEITLYENCMESKSLPSIVYGFKTCSQKFKTRPQDKFLNNWPPAREAWAAGFKVVKFIGYDADESHRTGKDHNDKKYILSYKLVEWNWGRFECVKRILDEGFPLPPKSSCTFCPSSKPWEIVELYKDEPAAFYEAVEMERNAAGSLTNIKGLGRRWSWWDVVAAYKYLQRIRRHGAPARIPDRIAKMLKTVDRSKPQELAKQNPEAIMKDLFAAAPEISCECFDGSSE